MPIYGFKCEECGAWVEFFFPRKHDAPVPHHCERPMKPMLYANGSHPLELPETPNDRNKV